MELTQPQSPTSDLAPQKQRVLVIDDSPDIPILVKGLLHLDGIEIQSVSDGHSGLVRAREFCPDLILLDIDMPKLDGFEVCRMLKADPKLSQIPVIFLTGMSSQEERLRGLELGATDYVTKPFDRAELRARVRSALRTQQLMDMLAKEARHLQESEERFRLLAEDSSDLISRHSTDGVYLYASPVAQSMLGYRPQQLIGQSLLDLVHPEDRKNLIELNAGSINAPLTLRTASAATFRIRCADDTYRWCEGSIHAVQNGSQFQISCRDVSGRKREEELEKDRIRVLEMVAAGRSLEDIMVYLTKMLERHYPAGTSCILALSDGQMHVIGPSLPTDLQVALRGDSLHLASSICSDAATRQQSAVVTDISTDTPWEKVGPVARRHGYRMCSSKLIQSPSNGVIGMVSVYLRENHADERSLASLFEVAASLISVAAEHLQLQQRMAYQASHDILTGLPNRALFAERLQEAIQQRRNEQVGLILFDVDRFKLINDTMGHSAGDALLEQVAERVGASIRHSDTLARLGGDEFAVILAAPADRETAAGIARQIQEAIRSKFSLHFNEVTATLSMGIAIYPDDANSIEALQKRADAALYKAKALGRNTFQCYDPSIDESVSVRVDIESRLRAAIEKNELTLHYQPQVDRECRVVGMEALLRWNNPDLGHVSPADFISVAEESGLIVPIGSWVLRHACLQGKAWRDAGFAPTVIAVNVSALQFAQPDFFEMVMNALRESKFDPQCLELELTESSVMRNIHETAAKLRQLADIGVRVSIDDFGTGYSSLAYLDGLPLHRLKIDRTFVRSLDTSAIAVPERTAIIRAILSLGHSLGMEIVAEGVETIEQFQFLRDLECDSMQGYLFSRPEPAGHIEAFLGNRRLPGHSHLIPMAALNKAG